MRIMLSSDVLSSVATVCVVAVIVFVLIESFLLPRVPDILHVAIAVAVAARASTACARVAVRDPELSDTSERKMRNIIKGIDISNMDVVA